MMKVFKVPLIILLYLFFMGTGYVDESKKIWGTVIYPAGLGTPNMKFDLGNYETLEQFRDAAKTKI